MQADRRKSAASAVRAHRDGNADQAQNGYIRHLAAYPDDAGIWSNLGSLFRTRGLHDQALRAQERAFSLDPGGAGIRNNYANILSDLGHYDESLRLRYDGLSQDPGHLMHHAMIGRCLRGKGAYEQAIDHLAPAAAAHPEEPEIALQLAFAQLSAGRYGPAFRTYGARWRCAEMTPRKMTQPLWQDGDPLEGKTILVLPEQGFGDAVLMARFVPVLAQHGAKVHFLAEKPMARLFKGLEGAAWVGLGAPTDGPYDCWMNLMDMPLVAFGPDEDGLPPPPARLNIPGQSRARARAIVSPHRKAFKVGVVWSGSSTYKGNAFRSFSHREFLPLTDIPGVQLFSLYKGPYLDAYRADGSDAFIQDAASTDQDFADCAATMLEMDLVITSDTATAHIAGSLGIPVWTVLHWDPFWVFGHSGMTTDWYPSMRLFRQTTPRDWTGPFAEVEAALRDHMKGTQ